MKTKAVPAHNGGVRVWPRWALGSHRPSGGPDQARRVGGLADGVMVDSALIEAVAGSNRPAQAAAQFVRSLLKALDQEKTNNLL